MKHILTPMLTEQNNVTARLIDVIVMLLTSQWRHWNAR